VHERIIPFIGLNIRLLKCILQLPGFFEKLRISSGGIVSVLNVDPALTKLISKTNPGIPEIVKVVVPI
jgi:hypothetical protein